MTIAVKRRFARVSLVMVLMMVMTMVFPMVAYASAEAQAALQAKITENGGALPRGVTASRLEGRTPREGWFLLTGSVNGVDTNWEISADNLTSWYNRQTGASDIRAQVEGYGNQLDIAPDMDRAFSLFSGVRGPIEIILGIIALAIMHVLPLSAALDTLYLISPEFSNKVEEKKEAGGGMVREGKNGKKYMRWISREAQDALEKSYETGQPPYKQFMVFLIIKYVMAAILMAFVFTGNYMALLNGAMGLIDGLIGMFNG